MTASRRLPLLAIVLVTIAVSACGGGDESAVPDGAPEEASSFADEWPTPNGDLGNRRVATSEIDSGNVADLGVAWTVPIKGGGTFGNYASTPIIADGVVYTQDLTSNVKAIDLETGEVKWAKDYNSPSVGPNGVAVGYGKVYGATSDFAFALDIETGDEVWRSDKLTRNANEGIDMAPAVFGDSSTSRPSRATRSRSTRATAPACCGRSTPRPGEERWRFATVPENLWSSEHTEINCGGGLWHPPAFDDNGDVYISVANPAPWAGHQGVPVGLEPSRPEPLHEHPRQAQRARTAR